MMQSFDSLSLDASNLFFESSASPAPFLDFSSLFGEQQGDAFDSSTTTSSSATTSSTISPHNNSNNDLPILNLNDQEISSINNSIYDVGACSENENICAELNDNFVKNVLQKCHKQVSLVYDSKDLSQVANLSLIQAPPTALSCVYSHTIIPTVGMIRSQRNMVVRLRLADYVLCPSHGSAELCLFSFDGSRLQDQSESLIGERTTVIENGRAEWKSVKASVTSYGAKQKWQLLFVLAVRVRFNNSNNNGAAPSNVYTSMPFVIATKPVTAVKKFLGASSVIELHQAFPNVGPDTGGTAVLLKGAGFSRDMVVVFDTTVVDIRNFVGDEEIVCNSPPHPQGTVNLFVTNSGSNNSAVVRSNNIPFTFEMSHDRLRAMYNELLARVEQLENQDPTHKRRRPRLDADPSLFDNNDGSFTTTTNNTNNNNSFQNQLATNDTINDDNNSDVHELIDVVRSIRSSKLTRHTVLTLLNRIALLGDTLPPHLLPLLVALPAPQIVAQVAASCVDVELLREALSEALLAREFDCAALVLTQYLHCTQGQLPNNFIKELTELNPAPIGLLLALQSMATQRRRTASSISTNQWLTAVLAANDGHISPPTIASPRPTTTHPININTPRVGSPPVSPPLSPSQRAVNAAAAVSANKTHGMNRRRRLSQRLSHGNLFGHNSPFRSSDIVDIDKLSPSLWSKPNRSGYLTKRGAVVKSWRTRYFVLQRSMLFYFEFEGAEEPIGAITLADAKIGVASSVKGREHVFTIESKKLKRTFFIQCESKEEMSSWIQSLQDASKLYISGAFNTSHDVNVTYDSTTGFQGVPKEWILGINTATGNV